MNNRKVKFGIIGTGMIAAVHADALKQLDNAELVMVYDKIPEKAKAFAEKYNCQYESNFDKFLASDIEAVTIATPSGLHGEVAIPAIKAGKHILCEKPLETTVSKAKDLVRACEIANVRLSAVFQSRYSRSVQLIKKAVDEGRFGQPVLASASIRWFRSPEYFKNATWRGTWALDGGGALMNQGIHTADLLIYFNGDVSEVSAHTTNVLHKSIEVEDTVVAMLRFKNGSLGVLEDDRIIRWEFVDERPEDEEIRTSGALGEGLQGGSKDPAAITCEGHRRQISELAEAILNGSGLTTPGAEGKRVIELICAVYKSAQSGESIKFL